MPDANPGPAEGFRRQGDLHFEQGDEKKAEEAFRRAIALEHVTSCQPISVIRWYPKTILTLIQVCICLFSVDSVPVEKITDYLHRSVQPQIQILPGVGTAQVWGAEYAMRIWLDPKLMAAHNITPANIKNALVSQNVQSPGGQLKTSLQEFSIKTFGEATTAEQFNNLVLHR